MDTTYKYSEMRSRIHFRKDIGEEDFLAALNAHLRDFEDRPGPAGPDFPRLYILGLHRSGTTVLNQLLARHLEFGVVDNIAARFWLAPATGIRLSKAILGGNREISLTSDYGKTAGLAEPHEFSYFWQTWFQMENMPPYDPDQARNRIDWAGFGRTLRNMTRAWGGPMAIKAPDIAYHLVRVAHALPEDLFVHITRDPADIAVSLLHARQAYYGNTETWIGSYPVGWEHLRDLDGPDQVAGQVLLLESMARQGLAQLPPDRVVSLQLAALCRDPAQTLEHIRQKFGAWTRLTPAWKGEPPPPLHHNTYADTPQYRHCRARLAAMAKRLTQLGLLPPQQGAL